MKDEDKEWMKLALAEARKGLGATSPNPPVGAALVRNGHLLATGYHVNPGGDHAEIAAMKSAGEDLSGAALYVTLEPCSTYGRTPPCVEAILKAGIRKVIVGIADPNPKHAGRGIHLLRDAGVEVTCGVCEDEASRLIRFFAKHVHSGRPYVIAKAGMTLDGRISPVSGQSPWITSEAARLDVQRLRSEVDAILVGGETVRQDNPQLTLRGDYANLPRPQPLRVVVTKRGNLPEDALLFTDQFKDRTRLFHVEQFNEVFDSLGRDGVMSVLLECGGRLMAEAFSRKLVDEITFYVAPKIGGGGRRAVEGQDFDCYLQDMRVTPVGPDFRFDATVRYTDA